MDLILDPGFGVYNGVAQVPGQYLRVYLFIVTQIACSYAVLMSSK